LIEPSHKIRLCDFGNSKKLLESSSNVTYICSRYYRAPELIFGNKNYDHKIDMWSIGCVIAEMLCLKPLFLSETSEKQIIEIIKVLGTPNSDDL